MSPAVSARPAAGAIAVAAALAAGAIASAAGPAAPAASRSLAVRARSTSSVTLGLPRAHGGAAEGRYRRLGTRAWRSRRLARARRWTVTGLAPATRYEFELRACRAKRCGPWSRPLRVRTLAAAAPPPARGAGPTIGGCRVFPPDNPWNQDISAAPVDPMSDAYLASIGATGHLHPDTGSNPSYGIPYTIVGPAQPLVPITFTAYGDQSDPGPYPIPPSAPVEAGSDRHVLVVQTGACKLYELFNARRSTSGNGWDADSGARFDLNSNALRPEGWTSADAAGLPILPGLIRYDETQAGEIDHALRFTVQRTQRGYIHPATHFASSSSDPSLPPMGLRLRLRADYDISHYTGAALVILTALKRFGMIVADNGSNWYVSGASDPRWNDGDLNQLKLVPGSAFEVVKTGPILHNG